MGIVLVIGLIMVGFNIFMSYVELKPFLSSIEEEKRNTHSFSSQMSFPFRIMWHLPKLIPSIMDILAMILFTNLFNLGSGYAGGITGLFASNVLSVIIYVYVRRNKDQEPVEA
jgi:ABC-type uncharacterized transport system permease subunit